MRRKECFNFGRVTADYEELRETVVLCRKSQLQHAGAWDNKNVKVCRKTVEAAAVGGGAAGALEYSVNMLMDKGRLGSLASP